MKKIVIATIKSWNIRNARSFKKKMGPKWEVHLFSDPKALTEEALSAIKPQFVFFPHWSWIIPKTIYEKFNCVVFHMTDLPFGRGGSPLQNLLIRNITKTKVSAIKVQKGLDTGAIYLKVPLAIPEGNADDILKSVSDLIFSRMIPEILEKNPKPRAQKGRVVEFKRRTPDQSSLSTASFSSLNEVYNFIRMLDGEGYPKAFHRFGEFKVEFSDVENLGQLLKGRFEITHETQKNIDCCSPSR